MIKTKFKKSSIGIGVIIFLIVALFTSAIIAFVLLKTNFSLTDDMIKNSKEKQKQITTYVNFDKLIAKGPGKHYFTDFELYVKSLKSSKPIYAKELVLIIDGKDFSKTLYFKPGSHLCKKDNSKGYNTNSVQELGAVRVAEADFFNHPPWFILTGGTDIHFDIDGDGLNDTVHTCGQSPGNPCPVPYNGKALRFDLTHDGIVYVPLINDDGSQAYLVSGTGGAFNFTHLPILNYGFMQGNRTEANNDDQISSQDNGTFKIFLNYIKLDDDLDNDFKDDYLYINHTHIFFKLSSLNDTIKIPFNTPLDAGANLDVDSDITYNGKKYGEVVVKGTITKKDIINEAVEFKIIPNDLSRGYFSIQFLVNDSYLNKDIIVGGTPFRICFESGDKVEEGKYLILNLLPRDNLGRRLTINLPEVVNKKELQLYP